MSNDPFDLNATQMTYINQFLFLANSKLDSQIVSKIIWSQYYHQEINLSQARSLASKINVKQLGTESYLKKIYGNFGLAATGIDLFVDCVKIARDNKISDEKKGQEITKKLGGAATSTAVGIKAAKYIAKGIKILRSTTGIGIIGGFALDCIFSYLLGKTTDDLTEDLLQKIFDYMGQ